MPQKGVLFKTKSDADVTEWEREKQAGPRVYWQMGMKGDEQSQGTLTSCQTPRGKLQRYWNGNTRVSHRGPWVAFTKFPLPLFLLSQSLEEKKNRVSVQITFHAVSCHFPASRIEMGDFPASASVPSHPPRLAEYWNLWFQVPVRGLSSLSPTHEIK